MDSKSAGYPRFRLLILNPPDFFEGVFADEKKTSGSASIDASRLIFQSAVSFSNPLISYPYIIIISAYILFIFHFEVPVLTYSLPNMISDN